MVAGPRLSRFLVALLAVLYAMPAPGGSLTCTITAVENCALPSDERGCADSGLAPDCAMACATSCVGALPQAPVTAVQGRGPAVVAAPLTSILPLRHIGPEPPPPRMG